MQFLETPLRGAYVVELEPSVDERGFLARAFCQRTFAERGLAANVAQANLSHNVRRGTVRGLHYQVGPSAEAKFVRCVRGAIYDVIVDMRPDSPTYRQWFGVELSVDNGTALYVPELFAHGFQSLVDDTLVFYQTSAFYDPSTERGVRHDDPALSIDWPLVTTVTSDKDASWPFLDAGGDGGAEGHTSAEGERRRA